MDELGTIKSYQARLHIKSDEPPRFFETITIPYALNCSIKDELDHLKREGILGKVTQSEWVNPIVAVPKPDGQVCLYGYFKVTLNQFLMVNQYPISTAQDLHATWAGGKKFSKLDLSQAFL